MEVYVYEFWRHKLWQHGWVSIPIVNMLNAKMLCTDTVIMHWFYWYWWSTVLNTWYIRGNVWGGLLGHCIRNLHFIVGEAATRALLMNQFSPLWWTCSAGSWIIPQIKTRYSAWVSRWERCSGILCYMLQQGSNLEILVLISQRGTVLQDSHGNKRQLLVGMNI